MKITYKVQVIIFFISNAFDVSCSLKNGNLNIHNNGKRKEKKKVQKTLNTPIKYFKINCEILLLISILINREKINDCFEIILNSKFSINLYFNNGLYLRLIWT